MSDKQSSGKFSEEYIRESIASVPYWWHRIEVAPGIFTPGHDNTHHKKEWMRLPKNMRGKRVLDIGAYEGFFSFECERRGADVTAVDVKAATDTGFAVVHELLNSKVNHLKKTVYNLDPEEMGHFDIVLFLGVLYHLRHPLLALDKIYSVCNDLLILESQICDSWFINKAGKPVSLESFSPDLTELPLAQFYPYDELSNDPSNWWSPNLVALEGMIKTSGFEPELVFSNGVRAVFHCKKLSKGSSAPESVKEDMAGRKLPNVMERSAPGPANAAMAEQVQELQQKLRITEEQLAAIESTRTWRLASKLSYSRFGRMVSRLVKPFFY